jgi:hypothetical protein
MDSDDADAPLGFRFWSGTALLVAATIVLSWLIVRLAIT